jgi:hypothetical protein
MSEELNGQLSVRSDELADWRLTTDERSSPMSQMLRSLSRHGVVIFISSIVLIVATACASGEAPAVIKPAPGAPFAAAAKPAEAPKPAAPAPAAPAPAKPAEAARPADPSAPATKGGQPLPIGTIVVPIPNDLRMVIYESQVTLDVESLGAAQQRVAQIAEEEGGYVANTSASTGTNRAEITIKVRADRYRFAMDHLRGIARVVISERATSQDVTEEFFDVDVRLRTLRVTHERFQGFLEKATGVDEVMRIQLQISQIEQQINQLEGRRKFLERRTDLATIAVTLVQPVATATPVPVPTETPVVWNPGRVANDSFSASIGVLKVIASVGIAIVAFGWWLVPIGLAAWWFMRGGGYRNPAPRGDDSSKANSKDV